MTCKNMLARSKLFFPFAGNSHRRFDEDTDFTLIKVVVLGAPGVGKTSIVKVSYPLQNTTLEKYTLLEWVNRKAPDDEKNVCVPLNFNHHVPNV